MGSLSFSEIVVIVLVILIVFGPNRLPDLARRAGEFMNKVRNASSSMTEALGVDYEETVEPFTDCGFGDGQGTFAVFGQAASASSTDSATLGRGRRASQAISTSPIVMALSATIFNMTLYLSLSETCVAGNYSPLQKGVLPFADYLKSFGFNYRQVYI